MWGGARHHPQGSAAWEGVLQGRRGAVTASESPPSQSVWSGGERQTGEKNTYIHMCSEEHEAGPGKYREMARYLVNLNKYNRFPQ